MVILEWNQETTPFYDNLRIDKALLEPTTPSHDHPRIEKGQQLHLIVIAL